MLCEDMLQMFWLQCLQAFSDKLVEIVSMDDDYVWIHDYHLMVSCAAKAICMKKPSWHRNLLLK